MGEPRIGLASRPDNRERGMAQQRLPMRKIRDVLRLSAAGMSKRKIAVALGIGATAAGECLRRAREAGVGWPLPDDMTDAGLEARLYPASMVLAEVKARRPQPDWPAIHRELKRKGVTLQLVWEEHRASHPDGYGYSRFCELYRAWEKRLSPTMQQTHVSGEKLFVDYPGTTMQVIDSGTGEVIEVQLFVAVLGASSYTFAEATWTQTLPDWIGTGSARTSPASRGIWARAGRRCSRRSSGRQATLAAPS